MNPQHQTPGTIKLDAASSISGELEQSSIGDMPDLNDPFREEHDPRTEA